MQGDLNLGFGILDFGVFPRQNNEPRQRRHGCILPPYWTQLLPPRFCFPPGKRRLAQNYTIYASAPSSTCFICVNPCPSVAESAGDTGPILSIRGIATPSVGDPRHPFLLVFAPLREPSGSRAQHLWRRPASTRF